MQIIEKRIDEIQPYENNPRKNDDGVDAVANSIKEFGFKVPIIVDSKGVIVAGHTRYLAAIQLKLKTVPVIVADDLSDKQIKAFRLADNKTAELSSWDMDMLLEEIEGLDFDLTEFGFAENDTELDEILDNTVGESKYSRKVKIPQYEPTGRIVDVDECINTHKTDDLIEEINEANIPEETKAFLREAAHRHSVFNYKNIAEYYANASAEVQRLMERSALVIIDIDDAIADGYVKLSKTIQDIIEESEDEE